LGEPRYETDPQFRHWVAIFYGATGALDVDTTDFLRSQILEVAHKIDKPTIKAIAIELGVGRVRLSRMIESLGIAQNIHDAKIAARKKLVLARKMVK